MLAAKTKPCRRVRQPQTARFQPRLERLEDRWVPSTLRQLPGFEANVLPKGDDLTQQTSLGFTINFFGQVYDKVWVNNNGYVNFKSNLGAFNPSSLTYVNQPIIAPFFADVDTTTIGEVRYGQDMIDGRNAFGVTWDNVGYYNRQSDRTNTFQLVIIDRSDLAPGAFDIEFNYGSITWDRGQASNAFARAGYSTGLPSETFELPGSGVRGAFLDGGPHSLADQGRVHLHIITNNPPVFAPIQTQTIRAGEKLTVQLNASDPDPGQTLTYTLLQAPEGATLDAATGLLTWMPSATQPLGVYSFVVQVQDSHANPASAIQTFQVHFANTNPTLDPIEQQTVYDGEQLVVQLTASDPDVGQTLTYSLLSGPSGATIDPATGLVLWTPTSAHPHGMYTFLVGVTDSADDPGFGFQIFQVQLNNTNPDVVIHPSNTPHHPANTEFLLNGRFSDRRDGDFTATVDFGDGTGPQPLLLNPDGSFTLRHTYVQEGVFTILVMVVDSHGGVGTSTYRVNVLPEGSSGKIEVFQLVDIAPGQVVTTELETPRQGASLMVHFARDEFAQGNASVFVAFYSSSPLPTSRRDGIYFDIQAENLSPDDQITLTFESKMLALKFDFGFFNPNTGAWVDLRQALHLADIQVDPKLGLMTVTFKVRDIFGGTVFTVSLPSTNSPVTGPVQPPTAGLGGGPTTDSGSGLARSVSFDSNAQLSLALTASGSARTSLSSTSQGSQAGNAAANGLSNSGGQLASAAALTLSGGRVEQQTSEDVLAASAELDSWRWLESEEGLLELLLQGVDPALILPFKKGVEANEMQVLADATPLEPEAVFEQAVQQLQPEVNYQTEDVDSLWTEEFSSDFSAAVLSLAPVLLGMGGERIRRRSRKEDERAFDLF